MTESTRWSSRATHFNEDEAYRPIAIRFTKNDGTKISLNIGCGLSWKDLFLVLGCYLAFYSFLILFCAILLKGIMMGPSSDVLLWTFNFIGMMFGAAMGVAIKIGTKAEQDKKAAELEAEKIKEDQALHATKGECFMP